MKLVVLNPTFKFLKEEIRFIDNNFSLYITDYFPYYQNGNNNVPIYENNLDKIEDQIKRIINSGTKILILAGNDVKESFYKFLKPYGEQVKDLSKEFGVPTCLIKELNMLLITMHHPSISNMLEFHSNTKFVINLVNILLGSQSSTTNDLLKQTYQNHINYIEEIKRLRNKNEEMEDLTNALEKLNFQTSTFKSFQPLKQSISNNTKPKKTNNVTLTIEEGARKLKNSPIKKGAPVMDSPTGLYIHSPGCGCPIRNSSNLKETGYSEYKHKPWCKNSDLYYIAEVTGNKIILDFYSDTMQLHFEN